MTLYADDLNQFTGTEQWYRHPLFSKYTYTDGVRHVAKEGGAYWLIDDIFLWQKSEAVSRTSFQCWTLKVTDGRGYLTATDGNDKKIAEHVYLFTDFPLPKITFYFYNQTLLLPSEY